MYFTFLSFDITFLLHKMSDASFHLHVSLNNKIIDF